MRLEAWWLRRAGSGDKSWRAANKEQAQCTRIRITKNTESIWSELLPLREEQQIGKDESVDKSFKTGGRCRGLSRDELQVHRHYDGLEQGSSLTEPGNQHRELRLTRKKREGEWETQRITHNTNGVNTKLKLAFV